MILTLPSAEILASYVLGAVGLPVQDLKCELSSPLALKPSVRCSSPVLPRLWAKLT